VRRDALEKMNIGSQDLHCLTSKLTVLPIGPAEGMTLFSNFWLRFEHECPVFHTASPMIEQVGMQGGDFSPLNLVFICVHLTVFTALIFCAAASAYYALVSHDAS
jgi:hypothetical protein